MNRVIQFIVLTAFFVSVAGGYASATEIKCLFPLAFRSSLNELVPEFEKSTGNEVTIDYGTIGALTARLKKDEITDVAIVSDKQFDELQGQQKLVAGTRIDVAKLGDGAFVRRGAPKPDISSVEAFKHTLLEAKTIAYLDPAGGAPSGIYMAKLMDRLGIYAQMTPKTRLSTGSLLFDLVINGSADIGFIQITELLAEPRVELLGPLPIAVQDYTNYAAGLVITGQQRDAGKALIAFITSPQALAVMKMRGFEPLSKARRIISSKRRHKLGQMVAHLAASWQSTVFLAPETPAFVRLFAGDLSVRFIGMPSRHDDVYRPGN